MHLFDQDTSLSPDGQHHFTARVSDNWSINGTPDGGYLMALLARAAGQQSDKSGVSILSANFISRCVPGPVTISLEKLGATRQFDRWQASLHQEGTEKVRAMVTCMDVTGEQAGKRYEKSGPVLAQAAECIQFGRMPKYTLYDHMEVLLDPDCAGWIDGNLTDRSELRGWIKFRDERPFDAAGLMLIADAFPPPIFVSQGMVAWVPTLEMSVNIRNLPQSRWLKCVFRSRFLNGGMVEEDGEIWDEDGDLVAISRQVAQYRKT